ncbi:STAS domain-containing protein [Streptomyces sp. NPDC090119]|uniref:STAS domain-containing protein n=1 Tax=Streptomyces sp. NPDC090119 TaxID=3365951 RepID=UPI0038106653
MLGALGVARLVRFVPRGALTEVIVAAGITVPTMGDPSFASVGGLAHRFASAPGPGRVVVDMSAAHVWDASSVAALDAVEARCAEYGKTGEINGLNERLARLHSRLTGELTGKG